MRDAIKQLNLRRKKTLLYENITFCEFYIYIYLQYDSTETHNELHLQVNERTRYRSAEIRACKRSFPTPCVLGHPRNSRARGEMAISPVTCGAGSFFQL